jgi:predicted RecA/RadA family phage recombinase
MSTRFIQAGGTLTMVLPSDTRSGDIVVKGALVGVAEYDAKAGSEVEVKLWGVHRLPKDGSAFEQGALAYVSDSKATAAEGENGATLLGVVARDASADAPEVDILLTGGRNI